MSVLPDTKMREAIASEGKHKVLAPVSTSTLFKVSDRTMPSFNSLGFPLIILLVFNWNNYNSRKLNSWALGWQDTH